MLKIKRSELENICQTGQKIYDGLDELLTDPLDQIVDNIKKLRNRCEDIPWKASEIIEEVEDVVDLSEDEIKVEEDE